MPRRNHCISLPRSGHHDAEACNGLASLSLSGNANLLDFFFSVESVVRQQLVDQIHVCEYHTAAAVPFQAELVHRLPENWRHGHGDEKNDR